MQRKIIISIRTLTNFFPKNFITTLVCVLIVSFNWNWVYAQYSKGDCIFRLTDEDGNLERNVPPDGWTPGHVGIWSGSGNCIWEAAKTHCYTKSEGWVTVDRVLLTNYSHYAWQEWEITRSSSILENSEAFMDSHFDYRDEVRNAIVAYAAAQDGESYNPPFGWYCTKLVHYAYNDAVNNYPTEHEPDYVGRPEKVTNLQSTSHSTSTWSNDNTVDFSWTTAYDFGSVKDELSSLPYFTPITVEPLFNYNPPVSEKGIDGYSIVWDHNPETMPDVDLLDPYDTDDGSATSTTCSCPTDANDYYFHIRSLDVTGNYSNEAAHFGPFYIDTTDPIPLAGIDTVTDTSMTIKVVSIIEANLHGVPYKYSGASTTDWTTATSHKFENLDPNTTYILTVTARDLAGNEGSDSESDETLPVELSAFSANFLDNKPTLYWTTQSETDNLGWNIYRAKNDDNFANAAQINNDMITGNGTTSEPHYYIYEDEIENPEVGDTYYYWLESIDYSGISLIYNRVAQIIIPDPSVNPPHLEPPIVYDFKNVPNPVSTSSQFQFTLNKSTLVSVSIYNIKGELVRTLPSVLTQEDETSIIYWNGKDTSGKELSPGVYFYTLIVNGKIAEMKKLILMK